MLFDCSECSGIKLENLAWLHGIYVDIANAHSYESQGWISNGSSHFSDLPEFSLSNGDANRKSTRLNSSHVKISYAVFCLKKKKKSNKMTVNGEGCVLATP